MVGVEIPQAMNILSTTTNISEKSGASGEAADIICSLTVSCFWSPHVHEDWPVKAEISLCHIVVGVNDFDGALVWKFVTFNVLRGVFDVVEEMTTFVSFAVVFC